MYFLLPNIGLYIQIPTEIGIVFIHKYNYIRVKPLQIISKIFFN